MYEIADFLNRNAFIQDKSDVNKRLVSGTQEIKYKDIANREFNRILDASAVTKSSGENYLSGFDKLKSYLTLNNKLGLDDYEFKSNTESLNKLSSAIQDYNIANPEKAIKMSSYEMQAFIGMQDLLKNEGEMLSDYHIARGKKDKDVYITRRYYLSDAVFLAGLESQDLDFLRELEYALKNPAFPLFLGRRSCVPTLPLFLGIRNDSLLNVLRNEEWLVPEFLRKKISRKKLRIVIDSEIPDPSSLINDLPVSFSKEHRKFALRSVRQEYLEIRD